MNKHKIDSANACNTGGGCMVYWGKLESGLYFRACAESIWILDVEAGIDNEEAAWPEFYEKHTVKEIWFEDLDDFVPFWEEMISLVGEER